MNQNIEKEIDKLFGNPAVIKFMEILSQITDLYPNDQELGAEMRKLFTNETTIH